ncbi:MAG: hypothetical protein ACOCYU_01955 [Brevefilum sp.]
MNFLMIVSFISFWIIVGNAEREPNWRLALIQTTILWGTYLILGTEILSLFTAIHRTSLSIMWALPILAVIVWMFVWLKRGKILRLPVVYHRNSWVGFVLDMFVILILVVTALVALISPPNSYAAMVTRMSRVAHWEQNETLAHYPTGIESQNSNTSGAEQIALNFYILGGDDRAVNIVAWIGFAGAVAAAASLAGVLGANVNGQRMAAVFTATLPVAITQASSMTNHMVVAFWIVSAVLLLLYYTKQTQKPINLILSGMAAALAIVTKPTAWIYLWPFGLYAVVALRRRMGMWKMLMWAVFALSAVGLLYGGQILRNQKTYGQFYRPVELAEQMNDVRNWRVMISNISRNAALHADLPFPRADTWLMSNLEKLHERLDFAIDDPRTTLSENFFIPEVNTSEETSGNPLHAAMIVLSVTALVGMVLLGKEDPDILVYVGAIFFSMILFSHFLKWQPSGGRLQLPFFILFAPLLAILLDWAKKTRVETIFSVLLLLYAMPWLFQTAERPIIPAENRTFPISVFNQNRQRLYFSSNPEDYKTYWAVTNELKARGIKSVGLNLTPTSEEYPFWALLGAPSDKLQIQWVNVKTPSLRYLNEGFSPEAIICEDCSLDEILRYSKEFLHQQYDSIDLFVKEK